MSAVLERKDYTPDIWASVFEVKRRMNCAFICFKDEDILVLEHDDSTFILANPVLGEEPIYDELGRVKEMIPMRNITLIWIDDWYKPEPDYDLNTIHFTIACPRLRILRPELCIKLDGSGEVTEQPAIELQRLIEEEEAANLRTSMSRMRTNLMQAVKERTA